MTASYAQPQFVKPSSARSAQVRVLHVVASLQPGGMERALARLLAAMADDTEASSIDHAVAVLGEVDSKLLTQISSHARVFHLKGNRRWGRAALWLRRVVEFFDPRVVHARGTATWLDATLATCGRTGVKLALGFHGRENLDPPAWRRRFVMTWATSQANSIVTLSQESAEWLSLYTRAPRNRITILPNGVDTGRFAPATSSQRDAARARWIQPGERFLAVCIANLMPIKRLDVLLEAWRRVLMVTPDARLIIAGEGPERRHLISLLAALRLNDRVSLAGASLDISSLLSAADLFVLPSDYECCSNALLEAMSSGLPCVATHAGGNPEIIEPHVSGWLVPSANSATMANAILSALLNADSRDRVGRRARACVLEHHRLDQMSRQYRELYLCLGSDEAHEPILDEELCPCAG